MQVIHLENQIFPSESNMRPYDPDLMNEEMKPCMWFCKWEETERNSGFLIKTWQQASYVHRLTSSSGRDNTEFPSSHNILRVFT